MHESVRLYVKEAIEAYGPFRSVVEIGSRDINGGIRDLFCAPHFVEYIGIDALPGDRVDVVARGESFRTGYEYDCVVCCEVLEHTNAAFEIIANVADKLLRIGGVFIMTCAGPNRPPHSAIDEEPIRPHEFYRNVDADTLEYWLRSAGFSTWRIDPAGADMRCVALL
jgi:hypothetical protein